MYTDGTVESGQWYQISQQEGGVLNKTEVNNPTPPTTATDRDLYIELGSSKIQELLNKFVKGDILHKSDIFGSGGKILSLGEGDFSFAKSIINQSNSIEKSTLTVTEYRSLTEISNPNVYANGAANIRYIQDQGVKILGGVDATKLLTHFKNEKFSSIVFHFPFAGGARKVDNTISLLENFIKNAESLITSEGKIYITTPKFWAARFQMDKIAERSAFELIDIKKFNFEEFPGYTHKITGIDESASSVKESYTFIYKLK